MSNLVEQLEMKPAAVRNDLSSPPVGKIMVVDDEAELKKILVQALTAQGFEVTGCSSGQQALATLRQKEFDLLLTDLMMPEMDGIALLEEALKIDPHLIGIMMTGQGTIQTAVSAMKVGAFDYVLKPFRLQAVMPVLTRAINMRRLRMENLQLRETVAIYGLCQTIAFTLDPQTVLSKLADAALQQTDADEVSILLPTTDGTELYVAAVRGEKRERLLGERIPLQESISSWVARERLPLILNGAVDDERFVALWPRSEIRSAVSVPMQVANKLVGIINLNVVNRPRPFTLGQMKALTILASTAAAALESASLYTQLRKTEEKYRSIFENATEGLFQTTCDGRLLMANPAFARILGYESPEEIIATITDISHQLYVDPEARAEAARLQEEHGMLAGFEMEAYRKNGEKIWIIVNRRAVRDQAGEVLYFEGSIEDITTHRSTEDDKRQTRQQYESLVQSIDGIVWELDVRSLTFTFVSNQCERLLGYTAERWISDRGFWEDHLHPDDRAGALEFCRDAIAKSRDHEFDYRMMAADGRVVWFRDIATVDRTDEERPRMRGVMVDITERKLAEEELKKSEERYRELVEDAHDLIYEHDLKGNFTSANKAGERITGYSLAESLEMNLGQMVAPEYLEKAKEMLQRKLAGERVTAYELVVIAKDGRRIPVEVNTRLVLKDGVPVGVQGIARDITERKQAEEALRESEARYRLLFESNPQPMWVYDLETLKFLAVNESAVHHYGYSRKEFLAMTIKDIRPAEDSPALHDSVLGNGEGINESGSWKHLKKDGSIMEVEITSHLLVFDDRRAELILAHDITERRQAEEALRESEARKRAILESSMDCIITMDHEGQIVDWNPAAEKTFGYTQQEVIGKEMSEYIIPQRFRDAHKQGLKRYLSTGQGKVLGQRLELSAQRRDGTEFPIELTITRIETKGAAMFTGYVRDITERKKAENRLSAQYAVSRALAESNTIGEGASKILQTVCESLGWEYGALWTVDRKANVLRCSQVWRVSGRRVDDFENASRQLVFKPGIGLPGRVWKDSQPAWIADVVNDTNFPRSSYAASVGLHGACAFPIRFHREILGVVEFFSSSIREPDPDLLAMMITIGSQIGQFIQRKRVEEALGDSEEQLRQSQKLEAIGQLAGGVAHDFNNLLTVIGGYSSIVLSKLPPESPHRTSLEEIKKAGDRAGALTRQLLAFSRKQILQPKVLDLNVVVNDLQKMVRRLIGEDIDLLTISSPAPGKVKADPGQIEQVLLNLIVNARDAMPKGGKLTIETRNVVLSEEYAERHAAQPGAYVMLAVSDTGVGINTATQSRIFEPFFTTKGSGKGTGLGLSTVYGIVKQSGGNIWVYSEVGRGSTFKVYLPQVYEAMESEEEVPKSIPKGTETVLLVEDDDQVRSILKQILQGQGYRVLSASNGEDALFISQDLESDIQLMITDVVMPQMSGRELAEKVVALRPTLPILFMSGYTDDAIVRHGLLDEKLNFLQKPFDSSTVARKVREVLDFGH